MQKHIPLLVLLLFVGLGCTPQVSTQAYSFQNEYSATEPETVEVFLKKPPDSTTYIEIGEIVVDGVREWEQAARIFRIKGAEFGANAVYVYKTITNEEVRYPAHCRSYYQFGPEPWWWDGYGSGFGHGLRDRPYPHRYYYCYGDPSYRVVTYSTVIGIAIRYQNSAREPKREKLNDSTQIQRMP